MNEENTEVKEIENQKKVIHKKDWDVLVILDACRYDYFSKLSEFDGYLEPVKSPASSTMPWLSEVWNDNYSDIVYVAGNPFVNSYGYSPEEWNPTDRFYRIIDAWEDGWEEGSSFLKPKYVGKRARLARAKHPDKKIVVHFMQPHTPYYIYPETCDVETIGDPVKKGYQGNRSRRNIKDFIVKIFGYKTAIRILMSLWDIGIGDKARMWRYAEKYGREGMIKGYIMNLDRALKEVEKLIDRMPGRKVITSDHGEFLGEGGVYGHNHYYDHPILRKVPWEVLG